MLKTKYKLHRNLYYFPAKNHKNVFIPKLLIITDKVTVVNRPAAVHTLQIPRVAVYICTKFFPFKGYLLLSVTFTYEENAVYKTISKVSNSIFFDCAVRSSSFILCPPHNKGIHRPNPQGQPTLKIRRAFHLKALLFYICHL